jgi:hypothetical protein
VTRGYDSSTRTRSRSSCAGSAPELAVPALERALEESEHDAFIRAGRRALRDLR